MCLTITVISAIVKAHIYARTQQKEGEGEESQ